MDIDVNSSFKCIWYIDVHNWALGTHMHIILLLEIWACIVDLFSE